MQTAMQLCIVSVVLASITSNAKAGEPDKDKPLLVKIFQQDEQFLLVDGVVKYGRKTKMSDVEVLLSSNGQIIDKVTTDKSGRYKFLLQKNNDYKIIIRKPGFEPKSVLFNTEMPDYSPKYNKYLMAVYLKRTTYDTEEIEKQKNQYVNPESFEPLATVAYDPYALEYTEGVLSISQR
jgi:hypothetical protein